LVSLLIVHAKYELVPRLVNTIPYHVVPAKAGIHAQHNQHSTLGMDSHLSGDDNKVPNLQDEVKIDAQRGGVDVCCDVRFYDRPTYV